MTLRRWLIDRVILLYPPEYRAARGDDIRNGLDEASHDATGLRMLAHVVSVAVHAWRTRVRPQPVDDLQQPSARVSSWCSSSRWVLP